MDSCKTYKLSVEEKIKNNTYYSVEFINDSKEINIIYLAKIAAGEIRLINQTSPTPKTFAKEN